MKRFTTLAAVLAGACTNDAIVVSPIVDVPTNDTASAFPLESITISIAHEGADVDIVAASFTKGETVEVAGAPFGDDLVMHLTGRVGTSDVAYGRTCRFSVRADGRLPTPHLFFSRSVKFGGLPFTPLPRIDGAALMYHDGSGILLGGADPSDPNAARVEVERFDPNLGDFRQLATIEPRIGAVAALLGDTSDARVALIGGLDPTTGIGATFVEVIEAENPVERRVERIEDEQMARIGMTATALNDGRVIAMGGMPPGGPPSDAVDEISISNGATVVRALRAVLVHPRTGHSATRLGDDVGAPVLVAGGVDQAGAPIGAAELFKPLSELFSPTFNATMIVPRSHHRAVRMPDGSVLVIGGLDATGAPVSKLELFTVDGGFVDVHTDLPPNAGVIDLAATTLPDGRVLLTGGRAASGGPPVANAYIARLDPIDGSVDVVTTDRLEVARAGHQATLLCDGTVLISGGTAGATTAERYNPPAVGRR